MRLRVAKKGLGVDVEAEGTNSELLLGGEDPICPAFRVDGVTGMGTLGWPPCVWSSQVCVEHTHLFVSGGDVPTNDLADKSEWVLDWGVSEFGGKS